MAVTEKSQCPKCKDDVPITPAGRYRKHPKENPPCQQSGTFVDKGMPPEAPPTASDAAEGSAPTAPVATEQKKDSAEDAADASESVSKSTTEQSQSGKDVPASAETSTARNAESISSSGASADRDASSLATAPRVATEASSAISNPFVQPAPIFVQPAKAPRVLTETKPMTELGAELAARFKEMFYAYSSRMERSVQATLGPSEIGSPCDRRIAMSLMRIKPCNPGGDNWASFVGTAIHRSLAEMFEWADANQGRFAVEVPLTFPSEHVPKGTADLLDRTYFMIADHKCMGRWSLDKLKTKGPSDTYRVQAHTYAYGAAMTGEKVEHVAIVAWPRAGSTLDDLYVWTERYDPKVGREALARVDRIAKEAKARKPGIEQSHYTDLEVAGTFPLADDCRFCPYHAPGDVRHERGCNGRE